MVKLKFNSNTEILEIEFIGDVYLEEIIDYITSIKENNSYPRKLKILTNTTNSDFNLDLKSLKFIASEREKALEQYETITEALIVDTPKMTAMTMIYQELMYTNKYNFSIFSSINTASKWIDTQ